MDDGTELNRDICKRYLKVLEETNHKWFYGQHLSGEDYLRFVAALRWFGGIKEQLREKLIKEGKL